MSDNFELFTSLRFDPSLLETPSRGMNYAGWNFENASSLYMLDFHRDRMLRAARHWGWDAAVDVLSGDAGLKRLAGVVLDVAGQDQKDALRAKVTISKEGKLGCETSKIAAKALSNLFPEALPPPGNAERDDRGPHLPLREPEFTVVVDGYQTPPSAFTHFKTTKRAMYDAARKRAGIALGDPKEVLLVNTDNGYIMEGSITTPYFWRGGRWVTPAISSEFSLGSDSGGQDGTSRRWALERGLAIEGTIGVDSIVDGEECWISNGVAGFVFGRIRLA